MILRQAGFCWLDLQQDRLGRTYAIKTSMSKIVTHVEKRSRFLRAVSPINPADEIQFGLVDCASIGIFFFCLFGLIAELAR